jgi:hypothetical protein
MRIALIGIFGSKNDEGMRNLCVQTEAAERSQHEVIIRRRFGSGLAPYEDSPHR